MVCLILALFKLIILAPLKVSMKSFDDPQNGGSGVPLRKKVFPTQKSKQTNNKKQRKLIKAEEKLTCYLL